MSEIGVCIRFFIVLKIILKVLKTSLPDAISQRRLTTNFCRVTALGRIQISLASGRVRSDVRRALREVLFWVHLHSRRLGETHESLLGETQQVVLSFIDVR